MRWKIFLFFLVGLLWLGVFVPFASAKGDPVLSRLLTYNGKSYSGMQDPEYLSYDQVLREYMVKRISKKFGVTLDPKIYSGFDLLEIEAFFRFKKSNESYDTFLKMFPRQR